jgi:hypothetical protein
VHILIDVDLANVFTAIANISFALACYTDNFDVREGIKVVILGHGNMTGASVYLNNRPRRDVLVLPLVKEPDADYGEEALLALMEKSETASTLALRDPSILLF